VRIDGRAVQRYAAVLRERERGQEQQEEGQELFHQKVTRCGSGFSRSLAVYHGISAKNAK